MDLQCTDCLGTNYYIVHNGGYFGAFEDIAVKYESSKMIL